VQQENIKWRQKFENRLQHAGWVSKV